MKKLSLLYLFLLLGIWQNGLAQTVTSAAIQSSKPALEFLKLTTTQYQQLPIEQQKIFAQRWNLDTADYSEYLQFMENSPNGLYYSDKHLDPSWILGFNAKDDQERKKYALIAIKNERLRIDKELAFQRVFSQLQKELYPNDLQIQYDFSEKDKNPNALKNVMNSFFNVGNSGKVSG